MSIRAASDLFNEYESETTMHKALERSSCVRKNMQIKQTVISIRRKKKRQHPIKQQNHNRNLDEKTSNEVTLLWRKTDTILCREIDNKCKEVKKLSKVYSSVAYWMHPWWINWQQFGVCQWWGNACENISSLIVDRFTLKDPLKYV